MKKTSEELAYRSQGSPVMSNVTGVVFHKTGLCGLGPESRQHLFLKPVTVDNVLEEVEAHFDNLGCKVLKHNNVKVETDKVVSFTVDVAESTRPRADTGVAQFGITFRPFTPEEKAGLLARNPGQEKLINQFSHTLDCALWSAGVPYSIYKTMLTSSRTPWTAPCGVPVCPTAFTKQCERRKQ